MWCSDHMLKYKERNNVKISILFFFIISNNGYGQVMFRDIKHFSDKEKNVAKK